MNEQLDKLQREKQDADEKLWAIKEFIELHGTDDGSIEHLKQMLDIK